MTSYQVRFYPSGRVVDLPAGSSLEEGISRAGLPLSSGCDGDFLCGFCRLEILEGAENLGPVSGKESKVLAALGAAANERLACQARVYGSVRLTAAYW